LDRDVTQPGFRHRRFLRAALAASPPGAIRQTSVSLSLSLRPFSMFRLAATRYLVDLITTLLVSVASRLWRDFIGHNTAKPHSDESAPHCRE
jgi:hypothetical protein